jgi:glycosyltransferase involved in cell wall biosynthesis
MFVAHFAWWAPRLSGLFESTKDQIKYERKEGLRSEFVHCEENDNLKDVVDDGWLSPISWEECKKADLWVMHSKIPEGELWEMAFKNKDRKPVVAVIHGPAEHMLLTEWATDRANSDFNTHINLAWRYDAAVVLNKHELDILELYDQYDRVIYIPNSIDLENYPREGFKWDYLKHPVILSCDVPRVEKVPSHIIWAMPRIADRIPTARLNLFSLPLEPIGLWRNLFCRSKNRLLDNLTETVQLKNSNLKPFMRGADIGFNNNISGIASRVTMEMMAMGVPVVSYRGDYTRYHAEIFNLESIAQQIEQCWKDLNDPKKKVREETIAYAQEHFDRGKEVKKYVKLYNDLLGMKFRPPAPI